jgi:hypothetical protein
MHSLYLMLHCLSHVNDLSIFTVIVYKRTMIIGGENEFFVFSKFVNRWLNKVIVLLTPLHMIGVAESGADKNIFWWNFMEETGGW